MDTHYTTERVSLTNATYADLMNVLAKIPDYVETSDLKISTFYMTYPRELTQEELDKLLKAHALHDVRHAKWEREQYARLYQKFNGLPPELVQNESVERDSGKPESHN